MCPTSMADFSEWVAQAEAGSAEAQSILGAILATGEGIMKDPQGALYWYYQAVKQGYVHAKWNAGSMLIDGDDGIEAMPDLGMRLIREAADANENSACLFLANCYRAGGYGLEVDERLAKQWEDRAWACEELKLFDRPLDVIKEYELNLQKPKTYQLLCH